MEAPGAGGACVSNRPAITAENFAGGQGAKLFVRFAAQFGQLPRSMHHQRRLVAFAALRHGRQIRRVGFNQDAIARRGLRRFLHRERLGKRHDAAEAQVEAEVDRAARFFRDRPKNNA